MSLWGLAGASDAFGNTLRVMYNDPVLVRRLGAATPSGWWATGGCVAADTLTGGSISSIGRMHRVIRHIAAGLAHQPTVLGWVGLATTGVVQPV